MSIQNKLLVVVGSVLMVMLVVSVFLVSQQESQTLRNNIESDVANTEARLVDIFDVTDAIMSARVRLYFGDMAQANNFTLVDGLTDVMEGTATLFSKSNGEFVRVSTNVKKNDKRATGTILSPTGKAIEKINNKQAYYGTVDILGSPYLTGYEPMFDDSGNVVGIWYVGYSFNLQFLNEAIGNSAILNDGFVALRDSKNHIILQSSHVDAQSVEDIVTNNNQDWDTRVIPFESWGYDLIIAVSNKEVNNIIFSKVMLKQAYPISPLKHSLNKPTRSLRKSMFYIQKRL